MEYSGYNGKITVEVDDLILTRDGMVAKAAGLAGPPRQIPLRAISGVLLKDATRMMNGHLTLGLHGADAMDHGLGAGKDPLTIVFRRKDQDSFRALHDWLLTVAKRNRDNGTVMSGVDFTTNEDSPHVDVRTASDQDADEEVTRSAAVSGGLADRSKLHSKLNKELDANLSPSETVQVIITGPHNQAVIGTDRRLFIYKKGFMAGATFGSEMTSWDYRNVNGVQLHTGMMSGAVVIQAPGQSGTKTSYWSQGNDDPLKAPNAIPVMRPYDQAKLGVAKLRQMIDAAHSPAASPSEVGAASAGDSLADELKKLMEMRNLGALSEEEFAAAKARLLGT